MELQGPSLAEGASAAFEGLDLDAGTVQAYHGAHSLSAFTRYAEQGVYVVVRTSNPGRFDLQELRSPDQPLFMAVADLAVRSGEHGNVGVVLGATAPVEVAAVRARFPSLPFLLPGVGRQGGDVEATVRAAYTGGPVSCLVAVASAVMYADEPRLAALDWRDRMRLVAKERSRAS